MNKNNLIGILLIALILIGFTFLNRLNKPSAEETLSAEDNVETTHASAEEKKDVATLAQHPDSVVEKSLDDFESFQLGAKEKRVKLTNDKVEIELSSLGAMPSSVRLLKYNRLQKKDKAEPLYLFKQGDAKQSFILRANRGNLETKDLYFDVVMQSSDSVTMRLPFEEGAYLDFTYALLPNDYRTKLTISGHGLEKVFPNNMRSLDLEMEQNLSQLEKSWTNENSFSSLYYKYVSGDTERLRETKKSQIKQSLKQPLHWIAFKNKFFASVLVADLNNTFERATIEHTTYPKENKYLKKMRAFASVPFDNREGTEVHFSYFYGPLAFNMLKEYDAGVDKADRLELQSLVYVGGKFLRWINLTLIMPVVDWLKTWVSNWGIIILLLTIIIKVVLSPLTFKSYYSQAKMRVLKPQVEAINKKYEGNDQATQLKRTQETMALYRSAGASPMSGCLPMLIQMPFLIAMFRFFPTSIDLRGSSFLWAQDLSSYDPILSWNANLPLIGDHISGFCLLWAIVNIVYSRYTMSMSSTGQTGQMKMMSWMPIMMSVMFFFFFNNNSSGLCYYYFISILITIVQFVLSRLFLNEEKLLARLEANKKKPRKKSGFLARLEEAQRQQQKYLREQQGKKR